MAEAHNNPDVLAVLAGVLGVFVTLVFTAITVRQSSAEYRNSYRRIRNAQRRLYKAERRFAAAQVDLEFASRQLVEAQTLGSVEHQATSSKQAEYQAAAELLQQQAVWIGDTPPTIALNLPNGHRRSAEQPSNGDGAEVADRHETDREVE